MAWAPSLAAQGAPLRLGPDLPYGLYIDPDGVLTIEAIAALPESAFVPMNKGLSLSYTRNVAWLRFDLPPTDRSDVWWLEIQPSMLDSLMLFEVTPEGFRQRQAGDHLHYSEREWPYRHFLFELAALPTDSTRTVYLRVQTTGSLYVLGFFWHPRDFIAKMESSVFEWGIYFGAMGSLLAFALLILTVRQTRAYVALAATLFINTLHVANFQGFLAAIPGFYGPLGADFLVAMTASLSVASLIWALREFVTANSPYRRVDRLYRLAALACLFIPMMYGFGLYGYFMRAALWVLLLSGLGGLLVLFLRRALWSRFDRFTFLSLVILQAGMFVALLPLLGFVSASETLLMLRSGLFMIFGLIMTMALLVQIRGTYIDLLAEKSKALESAASYEEILEKRITERTSALLQANQALARSEERYRMLTENMKDVVWCMDAETFRFVYVSPSVLALRGYTPEEIMAEPMDAALTLEAAREVRRLITAESEAFKRGEHGDHRVFVTTDVPQPCKDGSVVWTEAITHYCRNPENGRIEIHGVTRDISERRAAEEKTRFLAYYDPLTALPNRRLMEKGLQEALEEAQKGDCGALLLLDMDNFKPLNDTHGHALGDALLVEAAKRLRVMAGDENKGIAARLGGDEFVVLFKRLGQNSQEAHAQACFLAEAVRKALSEPYRLQAEGEDRVIEHRCSCSIGGVLLRKEERPLTSSESLKRADMAMYRAKLGGRNGVCFFGEEEGAKTP